MCDMMNSSDSSFAMAGFSSLDLPNNQHDAAAPPPPNPLDYSIYWESTEAEKLFFPIENETTLKAVVNQITMLQIAIDTSMDILILLKTLKKLMMTTSVSIKFG